MIRFLNGAILGMILLVPCLYLNCGGTISGSNYFAFQNQLEMRTPSASKRSVRFGCVILATSSLVAPLSRA